MRSLPKNQSKQLPSRSKFAVFLPTKTVMLVVQRQAFGVQCPPGYLRIARRTAQHDILCHDVEPAVLTLVRFLLELPVNHLPSKVQRFFDSLAGTYCQARAFDNLEPLTPCQVLQAWDFTGLGSGPVGVCGGREGLSSVHVSWASCVIETKGPVTVLIQACSDTLYDESSWVLGATQGDHNPIARLQESGLEYRTHSPSNPGVCSLVAL